MFVFGRVKPRSLKFQYENFDSEIHRVGKNGKKIAEGVKVTAWAINFDRYKYFFDYHVLQLKVCGKLNMNVAQKPERGKVRS